MKKLLIIILSLAALELNAQDLPHFKRVVKELSSSRYQGRGYARGGANKAGKYLEKEYRKAGVDFSMREYSPGVKGEFPVYHIDTLNFDGDKLLADLARPENAGCLVCCDFSLFFSLYWRQSLALSSLSQIGGEM